MRRFLARVHAFLMLTAVLFAGQAQASSAVADRLLAGTNQVTSINEGQGSRVVWIFFDPNCPYCHKVYERLRPWVGKDNLQFRWVPVGMLTSTSEGKAAALLQAKDPLEALQQSENDFNFSSQGLGGGIAPVRQISDKTRMDLQANLSLLQGENINGVPLMLFRKRDGGGHLFLGAPTPQQLVQLLGDVK